MATDQLILNNVLSFLVHRFGKPSIKQLRSMALDFYSTEELVSAKRQLLSDISDFRAELMLPHVPDRRDGEGCAAKVIDDLLSVLTCLDDKLKLRSLPKYVADGPDVMPSTRLYEGDMSTLMNLIKKLNDKLEETRSSLFAIVGELQSVKQQVKVLSTSGVRPVVDHAVPPAQLPVVGMSGDESETRSRNSQLLSGLSGDLQSAGSRQPGTTQSWAVAAAAASSAEPALRNRFAPLQSTDDDYDDHDDGDQNEPSFIEHHSRRSVKRLRRQSSQQQLQQQQQQQQEEGRQSGGNTLRRQPSQQQQQRQQQQQHQEGRQSDGNTQRRGRVVMTGKFAGHGGGIAAAKSIIRKAVFCVDNVRTSYDVNDVTRFVGSLKVKVFSCFKVNPRRRRNETGPISDRNAFRLCIAASDRNRLLDESKWPESVVISDWYFLNPSVPRQQQQQQQQHDDGVAGVSRVATPSPVIDVSETNAEAQDSTVIYYGDDDGDDDNGEIVESMMVTSNDGHGC